MNRFRMGERSVTPPSATAAMSPMNRFRNGARGAFITVNSNNNNNSNSNRNNNSRSRNVVPPYSVTNANAPPNYYPPNSNAPPSYENARRAKRRNVLKFFEEYTP
jgi:hypothetical protein